eukprot:12166044-Ditylum_brightwellii.AAC.1
MGLPIKFKEGHVLKLNCSLYGLKQSSHNFFEFLKKKLLRCGFVQSQHDHWLFINDKVICLVYVNDCLFFAPDSKNIQ